MPPELILDPETIDLSRVVATREQLRDYNPQRFDMEQLDGIVFVDRDQHLIIGYKDVRDDEFWARGHMPGWPLLPGVLMCEAAAQMVGYYVTLIGLKVKDYVAFGGMENVRFRGVVRPGDRLVLVGRGVRVHRRQTVFNVQGFVGKTMVFQGDIIGIQLNKSEMAGGEEK
jgi:3-hydroxyacyl-[acyl-carrier-protein] dehydratase